MTNNELVSIHCMAYNHANYIRECLDGFVKQKTNFPFIAYVGDDCSTDGTTEIIKEYEKKYPDIIKGIYHKKNTKAEGNFFDILKQCKGKYLIFCEGDDYWTDINKLQKQVDFMEQNNDYTICFHPVLKKFENNYEKNSKFPTEAMIEKGFSFENLLKYNFMQTNSVMYRSNAVKDLILKFPKNMMPGDWYLHLLFARQGKIKYLDDVMAVYRIHSGCGWGNYNLEEKIIRYQFKFFNFYFNVYNNITNKSNIYKLTVLSKYRELFAAFLKNRKYSKIFLMMIYHPILMLEMLFYTIRFTTF